MLSVLTPRQRIRARFRRAAALAMIAFQGAAALAPLAQSVHPDRLRAHVESRGATHPNGHDEATCARCSAQSMQDAVPARSCGVTAEPGRQCAMTEAAFVAPALDVGSTNLSRAPPLAG